MYDLKSTQCLHSSYIAILLVSQGTVVMHVLYAKLMHLELRELF